MTLLEDFFNFFKRSSDGLWIHEEDMDESSEVEGSKNEIGLPCNCVKARGDSEGKSKVEKPISCLIFMLMFGSGKSDLRKAHRCQRYCLSSDLQWILEAHFSTIRVIPNINHADQFSRVRPGNRTQSDCVTITDSNHGPYTPVN